MTDIRMADVSEWQANVDASAYLGAGYKCIIARAHSGNRPDKTMPGRRDYLRGHPFAGVGWYHYLVDERDAAAQAHDFVDTIGTLKANEWPILDAEEGAGSQTGRAEAWFSVVDKWAGFPAMLYASDSFLRGQLSGSGHWGSRPICIAAYPSSYSPDPGAEPSQKHCLWQYSDRASFPGIAGGSDASIAHYSASDFVALCRSGAKPAAPAAKPVEAEAEPFVLVKADGRLEAFVQENSGEVRHAYQTATDGGWAGAEPGKAARWYSLGNPGR